MIRRDELPSPTTLIGRVDIRRAGASSGCCMAGKSHVLPEAKLVSAQRLSNELRKLAMSVKKPSLGRGLAELSPLLAQRARAPLPEPPPLAGDRLANLPLDLLQRGKYQPRVGP